MKRSAFSSPVAERFLQVLVGLLPLLVSGCVTMGNRPPEGGGAERKAIEFLQREVPAWSRVNGCSSCHNNGDGARALYAAARRGYRIPWTALADTTAWVSRPQQWDHNQGDPGFSDQRLADIQFAGSLLAAVESGRGSNRTALAEAARRVAADQAADGAWHIESLNHVGSPATYGTPLATFMAWCTLKRAGLVETRTALAKAEGWLAEFSPKNVVDAAALLWASAKIPAIRKEPLFELIQRAQTPDGGWGPYADSPPESFDTALVLLALAEWPPNTEAAAMRRRGRGFLVRQQEPDGSWPPTTRPSGGTSYAQRISTTGWATLALLGTRE